MSKTALEYAEQCLGLGVPKSALADTLAIFRDVPMLRDQLSEPLSLWSVKTTSLTASFPRRRGIC